MVQCIDYSDVDGKKAEGEERDVEVFLIGGAPSEIKTLNTKLGAIVATLPKIEAAPPSAGGAGGALVVACYSAACRAGVNDGHGCYGRQCAEKEK
jgi:hypothetical protein